MSKNTLLAQVSRIEAIELEMTLFNSKRALAPIDKALYVEKIGSCSLLIEPNSPKSPYYNRVKGFGINDLDQLDHIISIYDEKDLMTCFDMTPNNLNEEVSRALSSRGFIWTDQLVFMTLSSLVENEVDESIKIVDVTDKNAEEFVNIIIASNNMSLDDEVIKRKKHFFHQPIFHNYIVYIDEKVAGIGSLYVNEKQGYIANDYVFPDARGKNCQKALVTHRINKAKQMGLESLFTDVEFGSISHNNMEKVGFKTVFINSFWLK